ncbi:MAG: HAD family hydrolase [Rhizobiaceae bacterium]|nr:HAD family hydrolase [Rhizobiaceae bacterium]
MELTTLGVFRRYEELRERLPQMPAEPMTRPVGSLLDLVSEIDVFLFDAFGVLVVGDTPIPGTVEALDALKRVGKSICILTNAATKEPQAQFAKYAGLGFPIAAGEVVSSRSIAVAAAERFPHVRNWAAILPAAAGIADLPDGIVTQASNARSFWEAGGYLFLSSKGWTPALQQRLVKRLKARPAPVLVGNPDLVAPREYGLSIEAGFFAHDLLDSVEADIRFLGKPYANAFNAAIQAANTLGIPIDRSRVAMVGDTLHTDILGGAAAGLRTVLVTDHGVLKGTDAEGLMRQSGIRPDWITRSI